MHVIKSGPDLDVLEEGHSEDGKDEHDEEQEEADVDEGGKRHHKGKGGIHFFAEVLECSTNILNIGQV